MIVCKRCGTHNEGDATFCGTCGAFLEWEGERLDTAETAGSTVEAATPATAVEVGETGHARLPGMPESPPSEPGVIADEPQTAPPNPADPSIPEAVLPQAPRPVHEVTTALGGSSSATTPIVGGIDCWSCGLTNAADRRFCRRCGASLLDRPLPPAPVRLSWWRRLLHLPPKAEKRATAPDGPAPVGGGPAPAELAVPGGRGRPGALSRPNIPSPPRRPEVPKGLRRPPRGAGVPRPNRSIAFKGIAVVVIAVLAVIGGVPSLRHRVLNQVHPTYKAVALATPTAAGQAHCTDPNLANSVAHFSPDNTTLYWITGPVSRRPQHLTVTFQAPTSIARVRVSSNVASTTSPTPGAIPHPLRLQFSAPGVAPVTMTLDDPPAGVQAVGLHIDHPTAVTISLLASDPGAVAGSCAETAFNFDHKS